MLLEAVRALESRPRLRVGILEVGRYDTRRFWVALWIGLYISYMYSTWSRAVSFKSLYILYLRLTLPPRTDLIL
jgi:hypothetical protein